MRTLFLALALLVALVLPIPLAQAQSGALFSPPIPLPPVDATPVPDRPVPLVWSGPVRMSLYRVAANINDQVATTHVEQTFVNDSERPLEGTYVFPLPPQAAISEFNMVVDGQTVEGKLLRADEARAIYEDIVRQQRDPALLEYVGRDLIQTRIFPIPPGGQRRIELTYSQVLPLENGLIHYQYPLRTSHVSRQPIDQLAIGVGIESSRPLKAIYSPSHSVVVARDGEHRASVGYEQTHVLPASDFDLYFSVDEGEVGASLLSYKPDAEDGFFLLLAAPRVEVEEEQVVARDVLLVLDTSGSMQGQKIEQARNALLYVLGRLNPEDRFNVIAFSTGVRQFDRGPQSTALLQQARDFVRRLDAGGGTDINRALLEALAQVDSERPAVIIFLTDGLPTDGVVDADRIIENVRQEAGANVQIFAFGVGDDVNTLLLDTISQENRGTSAYVRPNQAIDEIVSGFYSKVSTPVLSNLSLDFGETLVEDVYPYPLPDLFAGTQLVLTGRYRQGGPTAVTLKGLVNGQERTFTFEDQTLRSEGGESFIARLWATRKIGHLLNQIRLRGSNQELVDEVIRLSTRYGIATPYTSFFVPEPEFAVPLMRDQEGIGGGIPARPMPTMTPAEAPAPEAVIELEKQVEAPAEAALEAMEAAPAAGERAVLESQVREALRSADTVGDEGVAAGLRYALDKAFAYQAGLWVDTSYRTDMTKKELSFGSEDYFALLGSHPDWSPYFAVSPNMIVVLDGTAFIVTDTGESMASPDDIGAPSDAPTQPSEAVSSTATPEAIVRQSPGGDDLVQPSTPLCGAPAFGVGLALVPGLWAWRRRRK